MRPSYDPRSGWADFLERYGQAPGAIVGLMGGSVLTRLATPSKGIKSILAAIGLGVLAFFMALSLMADATGLHTHKDPNPVLILVAIGRHRHRRPTHTSAVAARTA